MRRWAATEQGCGDGSCDDTIGNFSHFGTVSVGGSVNLGSGVSVPAPVPAPAPVPSKLYGGFTGSQIASSTNATFAAGNVTFRTSAGTGTTIPVSILPVNLSTYLRTLPPMPVVVPPAVRSLVRLSLGAPAPPTSMSLTPFVAQTVAPAAVAPPTASPAVKTTALVVGGGAALALLAWAVL